MSTRTGTLTTAVDDIGALSSKYVHKRIAEPHEIDLDQLIFRPVLVKRGTIVTGASVGALLARFPLHPKVLWWYDHEMKDLPTDRIQFDLFHSPASAYASLFDFFKGAMKFKLKLWTSRFHTGELMVVFVPNSPGITAASPLTNVGIPGFDAAQLNNYAVLYHDLKESNEITFGVPYQSANPMQRLQPTPVPGLPLTPDESAGGRNTYTGQVPDTIDCPGEVRIYVSKPIVAPLSLDTAIDYDLWASLDEKDCCFSRLKGCPAVVQRPEVDHNF